MYRLKVQQSFMNLVIKQQEQTYVLTYTRSRFPGRSSCILLNMLLNFTFGDGSICLITVLYFITGNVSCRTYFTIIGYQKTNIPVHV